MIENYDGDTSESAAAIVGQVLAVALAAQGA